MIASSSAPAASSAAASASFLRSSPATPSPVFAASRSSVARSQPVFRYSTTVGSTPFSRSSARALREVLHFGLWNRVTDIQGSCFRRWNIQAPRREATCSRMQTQLTTQVTPTNTT